MIVHKTLLLGWTYGYFFHQFTVFDNLNGPQHYVSPILKVNKDRYQQMHDEAFIIPLKG